MKVLFSSLCLLSALLVHGNLRSENDSLKSKINKEQARLLSLDRLFPENRSIETDLNTSAPGFGLNWEDADAFILPRLNKLNQNSPFDFTYNEKVKAYIKLYAQSRNGTTARVLGLSQMYFPLFEEELAKHNLPSELKCLAIVESALLAKAKSHASAVGLWQFIPSTGKLYGLRMNNHVDERSDPVKSTQAACRYLKSLYNVFGNWELVLAAYNSGPGTVNRAIRMSGGKRSYWEIYEYLPKETRNYVPAFIAVNYVVNYYKDHGIIPVQSEIKYCDFDTVHIASQTTLQAISSMINEPLESLRFLNPSLKSNVIPQNITPFTLTVPKEKLAYFYGSKSKKNPGKTEPEPAQLAISSENTLHRVKKGETLFSIARQYGISLNEIKELNGLGGAKLHIGQTLVTSKPKSVEDTNEPSHEKLAEALKPAKQEADLSAFAKFHVVEKGDTLWSIAQKYEGLSVEDLKKLNNLSNTSLRPGQKIIISLGS